MTFRRGQHVYYTDLDCQRVLAVTVVRVGEKFVLINSATPLRVHDQLTQPIVPLSRLYALRADAEHALALEVLA